jgi:WD40 repeat protein
VLDATSGAEVARLAHPVGSEVTAAFDARAERLLVSSWDPASDTTAWTLWSLRGGRTDDLSSVLPSQRTSYAAFDPFSEAVLLGGERGAVMLWQRSSNVIFPDRVGQHPVTAGAFGLGGALLVTGDIQGDLRVWARTGDFISNLTGLRKPIRTIAFAPPLPNEPRRTRVLTAGDAGVVELWDLDPEGRPLEVIQSTIDAIIHDPR